MKRLRTQNVPTEPMEPMEPMDNGKEDDLPEDIWTHILGFVNYKEVARASGVNKMLSKASHDKELWESACVREFGSVPSDPSLFPIRDWMSRLESSNFL